MPTVRRAIVILLLLGGVQAGASAMSVDEVISLSKATVGDSVINSQIDASGAVFVLSANDIIRLKENGVSESVMLHMIRTRQAAAEAAPQTLPQKMQAQQQPSGDGGYSQGSQPAPQAQPQQQYQPPAQQAPAPTYYPSPTYVYAQPATAPVYYYNSYYPYYYYDPYYYYPRCYPAYDYFPSYYSGCGYRSYYSYPSFGIGYTYTHFSRHHGSAYSIGFGLGF